MNAKEQRGRIYTVSFIATLIILDLGFKLLLLLSHGLSAGQVVGTVTTLAACWFFWRGSRLARGFLVVCTLLALGYGIAVFSEIPRSVFVAITLLLVTLLLALLAPATSSFGAYQRNGEK